MIAIDVEGFGSLDWRRADDLIARGYQAAEQHREELLKFRASDADWQEWLATRERRRKTALPQPTFLTMTGVKSGDAAIVEHTLARHLNVPVDIPSLQKDLEALSGLDRYESVNWRLTTENGRTGLLVTAREKRYAPPFLMLGLTIENTTSEDFRVQLAARYLAFDVVGSGSELRIDGALGADPTIAAALYKPIGGSSALRPRHCRRRPTIVQLRRRRRGRCGVSGDPGRYRRRCGREPVEGERAVRRLLCAGMSATACTPAIPDFPSSVAARPCFGSDGSSISRTAR